MKWNYLTTKEESKKNTRLKSDLIEYSIQPSGENSSKWWMEKDSTAEKMIQTSKIENREEKIVQELGAFMTNLKERLWQNYHVNRWHIFTTVVETEIELHVYRTKNKN